MTELSTKLRALLEVAVPASKDAVTHREIPTFCKSIGIEAPSSDEGPSSTKWERLSAAVCETPDDALVTVAERFLRTSHPDWDTRVRLEDVLWEASTNDFPLRDRLSVADALDGVELFDDADEFLDLLHSLFNLNQSEGVDIFFANGPTLRDDILRHVVQNPGDWETRHLFKKLDAINASPRRFELLLEGLASPRVTPNPAKQSRIVNAINGAIASSQRVLVETGESDGFSTYAFSQERKNGGTPKNIIFASSVKPDIRLKSAISNDIEIATGSDTVLIYDKPIDRDGLSWQELLSWWCDREQCEDEKQGKTTLYRRLLESLPDSPPQKLLFHEYYRSFGRIRNIPALIPEVWLFWDPKTVKDRGADALLRQRMDFLLLLRCGRRVVIEVDGKHHYAIGDRADTRRYSEMVSGDRQMKLDGFEVYRFGGEELGRGSAANLVREFFSNLFRVHGYAFNYASGNTDDATV